MGQEVGDSSDIFACTPGTFLGGGGLSGVRLHNVLRSQEGVWIRGPRPSTEGHRRQDRAFHHPTSWQGTLGDRTQCMPSIGLL